VPQNLAAETVKASTLSKFDPMPRTAAKAEPRPAAPPPPPEPPRKIQAKTQKPSKLRKPKQEDSKSQFLDIGAGFKIAHKPGSAYSVFYRVVAQKSHFEEVAKGLAEDKYDVHDKEEANKLLAKMLVPVDSLDEWCRTDSGWTSHAEKKTNALASKIKEGNEKASKILENPTRCLSGSWSGNLPEIISTCVGYYNHLMGLRTKRQQVKEMEAKIESEKNATKKKALQEELDKITKTNKNCAKFAEAGVVFRRYPLHKAGEGSGFVMLFPEKFIDEIKTAILVGRGINEDAEKTDVPKLGRRKTCVKISQ
jgi:hypothetical protein